MLSIFKKEFTQYFNSPIAYVFMAVFLSVGGWLLWGQFFLTNQATMHYYFTLLPWIFIFLVPSLTMRLWAEEKKLGSLDLLLTLPINTFQIVIGKFMGAFVFLTSCLILTLSSPISISRIGNIDTGTILSEYMGSMLLGGAFIALGMLASSLTKNQIIAFLIGALACFAFFVVGMEFVMIAIPQPLVPIIKFISINSHYDNINRGILDSRDIIYFACFIFFFLWLNVKKLESKN